MIYLNRELQLQYTDDWQNIGDLMGDDADFDGITVLEGAVTITNQGAGDITIKGTRSEDSPTGGSGRTIGPGQSYTWAFGFNAGTSHVKGLTASETGNFEISFYQ